MPFFRIFILIVCLGSLTAVADPIPKEHADLWIAHVQRILGKGPDFDVKADALKREKDAKKRLQKSPRSQTAIRDLADAYHTLAHMAEHEHDYPKALEYNRESLRLFMQTKEPTQESWDGIEHAWEHIFMDLYDFAVMAERDGDQDLAEKRFGEAWAWSQKLIKKFPTLIETDRAYQRYGALVKHRHDLYLDVSAQDRMLMNDYCQFLLGGGRFSPL